MNIETTLSLYLLVAANALLAAAVSLAIVRLQRMRQKEQAFWSSPTGSALLTRSDRDDLLAEFERRVSELVGPVDSDDAATTLDLRAPRSMPFDNAVRMAKHGASLDDLARTCGLSVTEARLLKRVHGGSLGSVLESDGHAQSAQH